MSALAVYLGMPFSSIVLAAGLLQADPARLVVLSDTGQQRDGLVVVVPHPDPKPYLDALTRGYAARLLRLYQLEQRFVRPHQPAQPAVLVLSDNQGGFPRWGLYGEAAQPHTAYVDLHRRMRPTGARGVDQIFPHELLHIIVHDLAGAAPEGNASQVHAVAVKTDRITAFNEGFAEHAQVMVLDDPDAAPDTHAAASSAPLRREVGERPFEQYRAALVARIRILPKAQITFPFWFSGGEQAQRYYAVRDNLFAREPDVPRSLYGRGDAYEAYLLENTLAGAPGGLAKPVPRMLATEGVVASLFYRLVTDAAIQQAYRDAPFYERFGTTRSEVDPLANAYLKVFAAIRAGGYDTVRIIAAYQRLFPDERVVVDRITDSVLLGQPLVVPPELWVVNDAVKVGTSLFDQYRGLPRSPSFDLNAASRADLVAVPGVDLALAERIIRASPFASVEDLRRVDAVPPAVMERFRAMRQAMLAPPPPGTSEEGRLTFRAVLAPYAWRAVGAWAVCSLLGAVLYGRVRRVRRWRMVLNGISAAAVALLVGWTVDPGSGLLAVIAPIGIFGLPGAIIRGARTRSPREAGAVVVAWTVAGLAAALTVVPIG